MGDGVVDAGAEVLLPYQVDKAGAAHGLHREGLGRHRGDEGTAGAIEVAGGAVDGHDAEDTPLHPQGQELLRYAAVAHFAVAGGDALLGAAGYLGGVNSLAEAAGIALAARYSVAAGVPSPSRSRAWAMAS